MSSEEISVLLIEDNEADAELAREKLEHSKILINIFHVKDGAEALDYLYKRGAFKDAVTPDLILLDLNLPKINGLEVLEDIKNSDSQVKRIPTVILTSSNAEQDIVKSYDLHASAYITKPVDLNGFSEIVKSIEGFWFKLVKLPPHD